MYGKHPGYLSPREEQSGVDRAIDGTPLTHKRPAPRLHGALTRYVNTDAMQRARIVRPRLVTLFAR